MDYPVPSDRDSILTSFANQTIKVWGFVLVRCSYTSDSRWTSFLASISQQTPSRILSKELLQWTTLEDKETLDNATMLQASAYFSGWVQNSGTQETGFPLLSNQRQAPRYGFYIYVNEETIESVLNPIRVREGTGNFLILVNLQLNLKLEEDDKEDPYYDPTVPQTLYDDPDESFKLISAETVPEHYAMIASDMNDWYAPSSNPYDGPPFVHGRMSFYHAEDVLTQEYEAGLDVYLMLKRIYGTGHYRSRCFTFDVAQTDKQRLLGYDEELEES